MINVIVKSYEAVINDGRIVNIVEEYIYYADFERTTSLLFSTITDVGTTLWHMSTTLQQKV
uniref:Uncharacterized protein n=1 Tax=Arion vulgaris TaxID=1028688 RepID=A0A0B7AN10_9EUPU